MLANTNLSLLISSVIIYPHCCLSSAHPFSCCSPTFVISTLWPRRFSQTSVTDCWNRKNNISVFVFNACKTMIPYDHGIFIRLRIMETNTLTRYRKSTEDRLSEMSAEHLDHRRTVIGPWCCRCCGTSGQSSFKSEMEEGQIFSRWFDTQIYDLPGLHGQDKLRLLHAFNSQWETNLHYF